MHPSRGGLRPIDLNSPEKAVALDEVNPKQEKSFWEHHSQQPGRRSRLNLKIGDYVFVNTPKKRQRGFDIQVRTHN